MLAIIPDDALPGLITDLYVHLRTEVDDARRPENSILPMVNADHLVADLACACLRADISLQGIPLYVVGRQVRGASPRTTFRHVRAMASALLDQGGATPLRNVAEMSMRTKDCASIVVEWCDRYRMEAEHDAFADIRGFQCGSA